MAAWGVDPGVDITVEVSPDGPYDEPVSAPFDVTGFLRGEDGIAIKRGRSDELSEFQAGTCTLTLLDESRQFDPALGPGDLSLPGDFVSDASTPDDASLDITGTIALGVELDVDDVDSQQTLINKDGAYRLNLSSDGRPILRAVTAAGTVTATAAASIPFGERTAVWGELEPDNGASGRTFRFFTAPTLGGTLTQLGGDIVQSGATTISTSVDELEIGDAEAGSFSLQARVSRAAVRDGGLGGATAADPDFTGHPAGTTQVTDSTGKVWTLSGNADIVAGTSFFPILRPRSRLQVKATSHYAHAARLPGASGATLSTPDTPDLTPPSGPGTVMVAIVRVAMDDWTPGGFGQILVSQWGADGNRGWLFAVNPEGALEFQFTTDGSAVQERESTAATGFADGSLHTVAAFLFPENISGDHDVVFAEIVDDELQPIGATVTSTGTVTVFDSTADLVVGDILPLAGEVYTVAVDISDRVVDADIRKVPVGVTSFTDGTARVWSVNGTAEVVTAGIDPAFDDTRTLFTGFVEGWPQNWVANKFGVVNLMASDRLSIVAEDSSDVPATVLILDDPVTGRLDTGRLGGDLPQQFAGERIGALLSLAGFGPTGSELDAGLVQVIAQTTDGNLLNLVQEAEAADAGFFYADRAGRFVFLDRHSRFLDDRLRNVQATFTDAGSDYVDMTQGLSNTEVWNDVRYTRDTPQVDRDEGLVTISALAPGQDPTTPTFKQVVLEPAERDADQPKPQSARDADSIRLHGRRIQTLSGPVISDAEALGRAQFFLRRFGQPQARPSAIVVNPRRNPDVLFPEVLRLELLDRLQIDRRPLDIAPTSSFVGLLQGLDHQITQDSWDTSVTISLPDIEDGTGFLRLDDATQGQLDQNTLAF